MLIKILAASALTLGLATAAVAESAGGTSGSGQSVTVEPRTPANSPPDQMMPDDMSIDMGTTGSIYGGPTYDGMNSNADRNCPASPQGAQPDANNLSPGTASPSVNDNHCGK
ncbi:hypothetical protein EN836_26620 [Mesorhizobium sp. M1C.F.Ca.ET.193.01.1.1]|uniref:hypothetical protein n=1 Tax=unclassified Mesorhizobium TaxID=325217 RepID=UPI000FD19FC6|nr:MULTISPECIES: hypothetical protein [unclassified Mesorhizobium]TGS93885.1 hypothetical protein EN820_47285 [bacterium M00.F.Ca.ET.177.01.1.1]RWA66126.1 MAG: hypothetical protein EOQ28_28630 [Mesorhizobium sp.]RWB96000.1 MAG: hypothetical protein EOQ57_28135 [Mesorhizobium sp.]TGQ50950.1 hypothetical protein EN853_26615 [Mesorhizobium sp. M1C.F.Ca.ET.210.01.1.1]TGQ66387.1 hypothetical protein EN855_026625 [Mesorhizobium sp. M1C.F.Ca.ET.212.01.1.1]